MSRKVSVCLRLVHNSEGKGMVFSIQKLRDDDSNLAMCYRVTEAIRTYLKGGRKSDAQHIREMNLNAMFLIMNDYQYDAFGRTSEEMPKVPRSIRNRLLRRFLMLAQRLVYPEYAGTREPVVLHIQGILQKLNEEQDWDIRILDADGPRVIRFFEILSNRLEKVKGKHRYCL